MQDSKQRSGIRDNRSRGPAHEFLESKVAKGSDLSFVSREAQRLSYAVQGMNEVSRARRKTAKLRSRLCGSGGQPRPRGRNRIDKVRRLRQAEFEAKTLYLDRLRNLADRSGAQRIPGERL